MPKEAPAHPDIEAGKTRERHNDGLLKHCGINFFPQHNGEAKNIRPLLGILPWKNLGRIIEPIPLARLKYPL